MLKYFFIVFFFLFAIIGLFYAKELTEVLIVNGVFSWFVAKFFPLISIVVSSVLVSIFLLKIADKKILKFGSLIIPIVFLILYSIFHPIFENDFFNESEIISFTQNDIIDNAIALNPNFNGPVLIATHGCEHCYETTQKFKLYKKRNPDKDFFIMLFTTQADVIRRFKEETKVSNIEIRPFKNERSAIEITEGAFPVIVYVKNGEIIKRWQNDSFGYRSFDMVEKGL